MTREHGRDRADETTTQLTKQREGDQPLPTAGRECVQDALIAEIEQRKQLGIQRYGSPLMTHNGRDAIRDAREEAVDLAVYLMQVELEVRDLHAERDQLRVRLREASEALRAVGKAAIVVEPTLAKPYADAPHTSPWERFMKAPAKRAYNLGLQIRRELATDAAVDGSKR